MPTDHHMLAPGADEAYQFTTRCAVWGDRFKILIAHTGETVILHADCNPWSAAPGEWCKNLTAADWGEFLRVLHRADFWSMAEEGNETGLDGMFWVISGRHGKRCHSAERWSPRDGAFFELGSMFLRLAGVEMTGEGGP